MPRMKRIAPLFLLALILSTIIAPWALAADSAPKPAPVDKSPAAPFATALSTITGIAISPLLGTGAYGAYQWTVAKEEARAKLPWFAQPKFWLPALLIVALCAAKDAFGTVVPPGFKKPLDVLELVENKLTGLVAAGAVVPLAMDTISKMVLGGKTSAVEGALASGGLAMISFAGIDFSWLLDVLTIPFGVAMFVLVWMASHAINVLILLSPWGAIDAALKAARTALLGLLTLSATINPWIGAALSLVVIVVAWLVAGWAFRLTVFSTIFSWEFFTVRKARFAPAENDNRMFSGGSLAGVPVRTYGRLVRQADGGLQFFYRPWLMLAERSAKAPATTLAVGHGLFFSDITVAETGNAVFTLPPRYRGHEEAVVRVCQLAGGVREAGLRKAWSSLRELFGGAAKPSTA